VARSDFRNGFFSGVGAGFALGVGAFAALQAFRPGRSPRVLRIEKSLQIGAPVSEVFGAWADLSRLSQRISTIKSVIRSGDRFRWEIELAGQTFTEGWFSDFGTQFDQNVGLIKSHVSDDGLTFHGIAWYPDG